MKFLSNKVFDMSSNLTNFKEFIDDILLRKDNAMALVHKQRQKSDKRFDELSGDVTLTKGQVQELVKTIQDLTKEDAELRRDADKKGERRAPSRVQSSTPPPSRPAP